MSKMFVSVKYYNNYEKYLLNAKLEKYNFNHNQVELLGYLNFLEDILM